MDTRNNSFNLQDNNDFLLELEKVIKQRFETGDDNSYIKSLKEQGLNRITQKVGEEAVETVIEALSGTEIRFLEESADLLFHYLILLSYKNYSLSQVVEVLKTRHEVNAKA